MHLQAPRRYQLLAVVPRCRGNARVQSECSMLHSSCFLPGPSLPPAHPVCPCSLLARLFGLNIAAHIIRELLGAPREQLIYEPELPHIRMPRAGKEGQDQQGQVLHTEALDKGSAGNTFEGRGGRVKARREQQRQRQQQQKVYEAAGAVQSEPSSGVSSLHSALAQGGAEYLGDGI